MSFSRLSCSTRRYTSSRTSWTTGLIGSAFRCSGFASSSAIDPAVPPEHWRCVCTACVESRRSHSSWPNALHPEHTRRTRRQPRRRKRAYHRYLERGGGHGMDFEDWLEAEREVKTKQKS